MSREVEQLKEEVENIHEMIREMNEQISDLACEFESIKKRTVLKPEATWPPVSQDTEFGYIEALEKKIYLKNDETYGEYYMFETGNNNVQRAIKKIYNNNKEAVKFEAGSNNKCGNGYWWKNMRIKKEVFLSGLPEEYKAPSKERWVKNNENKKFAMFSHKIYEPEYLYICQEHVAPRYDNDYDVFRISTTNERVKAYIMSNDIKFKFDMLAENKEGLELWMVSTRDIKVIEDLFK